MDKSLRALCDALKKTFNQLKPQQQAISFILLIGKDAQGKTTLLRQSQLAHYTVHAENGVEIYYNQQGVILELGEAWLNQNKNLLQYTLKQLNRCHRSIKISGIISCVDLSHFLLADLSQVNEQNKAHSQLIERFAQSLGYRTDLAILFTKADTLAGFCDFFQYEHVTELQKPLGFSLPDTSLTTKLVENYKTKFDQFIETLNHQIINKIHPARSGIKRTLIREFPLQLASLRNIIQSLINSISLQSFSLQALYFTSAEQGSTSLDRLTKKIQQEYALVVQDHFPQSINYRAYFVEGALLAFQSQTKRLPPQVTMTHKWVAGIIATTSLFSLVWIAYQYIASSQLLDETSKELIAYDTLSKKNGKQTSAAYHLVKANAALNKITSNALSLPTIQHLKTQLQNNTKQHIHGDFLPTLLSQLEETITNSQQSQLARYQALKIYVMLSQPQHFSQTEVISWFRQHWQTNLSNDQLERRLALLKRVIHQPLQSVNINQQIVIDARNYLNALPLSYLYYSLAKPYFSQKNESVTITGFNLAVKEIPSYLTKQGFQQIIAELPKITQQLQAENWVLERQDLNDLSLLLQQAYCYEYVVWWQNFMKHSNPLHIQDYQQAQNLARELHQANSINQLIQLIQQQTAPELNESSSLFNREIASKFTELSLLSHSAIQQLTSTLNELERFLSTLAIVNDQGKTAFNLTKARFQGEAFANPLTSLYNHVHQLPAPIATWAKQIADDTWFILINDSRNYINQQWHQIVFSEYKNTIANRYPFDATQSQEISINDFDHFFSTHGVLNNFVEDYLKPFLDTSQPQWKLKEYDNYVLPISNDMINELIRANVITNMFFPDQNGKSQIEFTLQKLNLDPIVSSLRLTIGGTKLVDTQTSMETDTEFHWPEANAQLVLNSIEGNRYELEELGIWAFFKILQKVNVLVDEQDSSNLQILFEVNGNSGRYLLKTQNQVNPFIPGILNGFVLTDTVV